MVYLHVGNNWELTMINDVTYHAKFLKIIFNFPSYLPQFRFLLDTLLFLTRSELSFNQFLSFLKPVLSIPMLPNIRDRSIKLKRKIYYIKKSF